MMCEQVDNMSLGHTSHEAHCGAPESMPGEAMGKLTAARLRHLHSLDPVVSSLRLSLESLGGAWRGVQQEAELPVRGGFK